MTIKLSYVYRPMIVRCTIQHHLIIATIIHYIDSSPPFGRLALTNTNPPTATITISSSNPNPTLHQQQQPLLLQQQQHLQPKPAVGRVWRLVCWRRGCCCWWRRVRRIQQSTTTSNSNMPSAAEASGWIRSSAIASYYWTVHVTTITGAHRINV